MFYITSDWTAERLAIYKQKLPWSWNKERYLESKRYKKATLSKQIDLFIVRHGNYICGYDVYTPDNKEVLRAIEECGDEVIEILQPTRDLPPGYDQLFRGSDIAIEGDLPEGSPCALWWRGATEH